MGSQVTGKPSRFVLDAICDVHGLSPHRVLMVGDMWSDITFGKGAGCAACLVLTGVATRADAAAWTRARARDPLQAPDAVLASVVGLVDAAAILDVSGDPAPPGAKEAPAAAKAAAAAAVEAAAAAAVEAAPAAAPALGVARRYASCGEPDSGSALDGAPAAWVGLPVVVTAALVAGGAALALHLASDLARRGR